MYISVYMISGYSLTCLVLLSLFHFFTFNMKSTFSTGLFLLLMCGKYICMYVYKCIYDFWLFFNLFSFTFTPEMYGASASTLDGGRV